MKHFTRELWYFGLKMAWASIFGGILLYFIVLTEFWYPIDGALHRFDFLFLVAVITQVLLVFFKLESMREVKLILIFHIVATIMEVFKTLPAIGSWSYPRAEDAVFSFAGVPLFAGFMYSAVGSFIARAWRIMDLRYEPFPAPLWTLSLSLLIYINFFTHHFTWDVRYLLFAASIGMFWSTKIHYRVTSTTYQMPFLLSAFLTAFFVWVAENIGTISSAWMYPNQMNGWAMVSPHKILSWYLLLLLSFGLVSLLYSDRQYEKKID